MKRNKKRKRQRPPLYKHQEETVNFLLSRRSAAILSEQGTGKTRSVIEFVNRKYITRNYRILVVCPATLINVWKEEINKYSNFNDHWILKGGTLERRIKPVEVFDPGWYIVNYEGLRAIRKKSNLLAGGRDWDVVIADEMTRIKNPTAKQSIAMHDFSRPGGKFNPIRIGLTGTPITQSPLDVFSQFKFVEPKIFGEQFYTFRNRYAVVEKRYIGGRSFNEIKDFKNTEEITQKMFTVSIRHTKKACLDLPEKVYQKVKVDWHPGNKKFYNSLSKELIASLKDGETIAVPNALAKLTKLRQVCNGFIHTENGVKELDKGSEKLSALLDLIEDAPGAVIVWGCFRKDIRNFKSVLSKAKISFVTVSGEDTVEERGKSVAAFQKGGIKVCIAQSGVAQYGITMTIAETAIFYSQGFSAEERMQAEDRNHRIGTKSKVRYIDLVMKDSVDESISEVLSKKKSMAKRMTNVELKNLVAGTPL